MESVYAGPLSRGHEARDGFRAARQQPSAQQQERQQPQRALPGTPVYPVSPGYPAFPGGFGEPGQGGNIVNRSQSQEPVRRMGGRLTADERRALRRQINEAGHDIYAPKH